MEVSDNIFLGSLECAKNEEDLKQKGITHILTVGRLIPLFPQDFKYFVLEIDDMETSFILESFNSAIEFIHDALENDGKVLIHCVAGVSRSPTIYLAYQMQKEVCFECSQSFWENYDLSFTLNYENFAFN
eukprot:GCRY01003838.1.p1 GENE.GCRY01003838.1~~GCRY01003838.1.p1  ORF type:complete len:130 (-),score=18.54 GCRY01003838.1:569-958(-)